ncbi:hypothetical protein KUV85_12865 [Nocardioides panacisoli]|nr:hypothetical protein [Nocardioides panacisoli]QYJ03223.1 hypothetical protein KUV85_12865 [Nocardioides panacisoli]
MSAPAGDHVVRLVGIASQLRAEADLRVSAPAEDGDSAPGPSAAPVD